MRRAVVLMHGSEVFNVVTANAEEGWIEAFQRDSKGGLVIIDGIAQIERIRGVVEIILSKHKK